MVNFAYAGLLIAAHVVAITYLILTLTGSRGEPRTFAKALVSASLALTHVAIEAGWLLALAFLTIWGAAMAPQTLPPQSTLIFQLMAYTAIPIFIVTLFVLHVLGKTTQWFKLSGQAAFAVSALLIAVDLVFNAGAVFAASTVITYKHL
ncbi:MAG TPA: hypothetical protein V6C89_13605 [Drouetiella sp.]|jgi:hypothetical protein